MVGWCEKLFIRAKVADEDSGIWGEKQAAAYLRKSGYRILGERLRIGRHGELDLVARDGKALVFVEVKTRSHDAFGRPVDAVTRKKKQVLCRAAMAYLKEIRFCSDIFRFDVIEVLGNPEEGVLDLRHIKAAFPMDTRYHIPEGVGLAAD